MELIAQSSDMRPCRRCAVVFKVTPGKLKKHDYMCNGCRTPNPTFKHSTRPVGPPPFCACGCGVRVSRNNRRDKEWVKGHHWRGVKRGPLSDEHRSKLRATRVGQPPPNEGKTKECTPGLARISAARTGAGNVMYGKRGAASANWKGGRWVSNRGYAHVLMPEHPRAKARYVLEHVLAVEQELGRYLRADEVVHHINGDKLDNSPANLWVCSQSQHRKAHHSASTVAQQLVGVGVVRFNRDTGEYEA